MVPWNGPYDRARLVQLMDSLEANGWCGVPLVTWRGQLLTGSHRYAAARALGWSDADIPTIDLTDVLAEDGIALTDFLADSLSRLTPAIKQKYGLNF